VKTLDEWRDEADDLIRDHNAWKKHPNGDVERFLRKSTGAPANRIELGLIADRAQRYGARARALLSRPQAALPKNSDWVDDLTEIAEECEVGAEEAADASHPDTVYQELDQATRMRITDRLPIPREKADLLRARFRGDRRREPSSVAKKKE
jgi:hypothetical protein